MSENILYSDGVHRAMLLGEPAAGLESGIHRYLVIDHGKGFILEHGLQQSLTEAFNEISQCLNPNDLDYVFIGTPLIRMEEALNRWLFASDAQALCSASWVEYLPNFNLNPVLQKRLSPVPDAGISILHGQNPLHLIPAHFLYKSCVFCLYDPVSKVLFSGDVASSINVSQLYSESFTSIQPFIEAFHCRYAFSSATMAHWVQQVRQLDIEIVAPGRGSILKGKQQISQLWDWLEQTPCGLDLQPSVLDRNLFS